MDEITSLNDLVDARSAATPERTLLVDDKGGRLSCRVYRDESIRVARVLGGFGIGEGTLVSWILPTGIDALVLAAALSRLGAIQNPIIPIYREREVAHIVDEASVDVLVVTPEWRGFDYLGLAQSMAGTRSGLGVLRVEDALAGDRARWEGFEQGSHDALARAQWIFYTSGSTGYPKGVRHTDASLMAAARGMADHLAVSERDRAGIAFPIAHIGGPINLMTGLLAGATLLLVEVFEPGPASAFLAREGVTMAGSGTAFHLAYLDVQRARPNQPLFPALRCCPGGGAPKPPGLHERVKAELGGAGIVSSWGLTEAPVLSMARPTDPDDKLSATEGTPLPGVELRVAGADGSATGPNESGELRVRAPQAMLGYVDAALDAEVFDADRYLRTGDLGTIDDEGYVRITGRSKDVVIRSGENIGTAEVEDLLRANRTIADAAVIGLPDERTGERVCAVLELVPGETPLDVKSVGEYLESKGLRRQAWPEQVEVLDALPRTVAGKIDKTLLRDTLIGD
jgi:acyl-CoA synthetase (AMP-forming)/AMP-acid ligase II